MIKGHKSPGIEVNQLATVTRDVLWDCSVSSDLSLYSPEAVHLLLGTAAVESLLGRYLFQLCGPAQGILMIEPTTEHDLWTNEFTKHPGILKHIHRVGVDCPGQYMSYLNIPYQIILARMIYYRIPAPIPPDVKGQAHYWKDHYNTKEGKGKVAAYMARYKIYVQTKLD